jgi:hypothetical protein
MPTLDVVVRSLEQAGWQQQWGKPTGQVEETVDTIGGTIALYSDKSFIVQRKVGTNNG